MSIHHMTNTRLFNVWQNIKRRCYTKTNPYYKYYGACGIQICDEWRYSFQKFYDWAIKNGYDENAPTEDVVEVRHGEWVEQIRDYGEYMKTEGFKCSVCGYETMDNDKKYCSECGAKMDGERRE